MKKLHIEKDIKSCKECVYCQHNNTWDCWCCDNTDVTDGIKYSGGGPKIVDDCDMTCIKCDWPEIPEWCPLLDCGEDHEDQI